MTQNAKALRRLYRRKYLIGFILLAGLACASLYIIYAQISAYAGRAELVNLASTQKALSQRIAFFSNAIITTQTESERDVIRAELGAAIASMRHAHEVLSGQQEISTRMKRKLQTVNEIYFNDYAPFDREVRVFLQSAETLLNMPHEEVSSNSSLLLEVNLLGMHTIMQTHDIIARMIAYETEAQIARSKNVQSVLTALILLLLIAEGFVIFEPMGRRIEENLRKVEISESIAKEEASRAKVAHDAKTKFLRVMSHELRTPLNAVIGMSNLLKNTDLKDDQAGYVRHINDAGQHMLSLANDILTLNQQSIGKLQFHIAPADIVAEISNVVDLLKPRADEFSLDLTLSNKTALLHDHEIDAHRFRQVIFNLVGNALKFTNKGGITVSVLSQRVDDDYDALEVRVRDTGIGIPVDKQDKIFEEFEQAENLGERSFGGAGLGLSISKQIIGGLGGELTLEESTQNGSTFLIRLKLKRREAMSRQAAQSDDPTTAVIGARAGSILVADDNLPNRMIAAAYLKKAGYAVQFAENGQQAMEKLNAAPDISLVFMDIEMPVMDGITATKSIRASQNGFHAIPVIALTAHALPEDCEKLIGHGFDGVLRKPIPEKELIDCVKHYLSRSQAA